MSSPSGFITGISIRTTSSRTRRISSVSSPATRYASTGVCWALATSVLCRPPSTQTTAFPPAALSRASDSEIRPRARSAEVSRISSSRAMFSSLLMYATIMVRPRTVSPISSTTTRSLAASSARKYSIIWP